MLKIVFFGTPDYVLPVLEKLHRKFKSPNQKSPIVAVVTQKPKPSGRKQLLTYSPVDCWAHKKGVPKFFSSTEYINSKISADIGVLASYSEIIPESAIKCFKYGVLNIHPSLLPLYRGASPVQAAIVAGDKETGVSIIKMDKLLDHGPIVSQFKEEILPNDTNESLRIRLFTRAAEVLITLLPAYVSGKITPRLQEHPKAAFTYQIKKEGAFIPPEYLNSALQAKTFRGQWTIAFIKDFSLMPKAISLNNFIRAMQPWPISWTYVQLAQGPKLNAKRLKILKAHLEKVKPSALSFKLVLDVVQLEGKNPITWQQFTQGYPNYSFA